MFQTVEGVSIHARLATGDLDPFPSDRPEVFQFTPVLRRATGHDDIMAQAVKVSIHARLATGDTAGSLQFGTPNVSIHARLATGDA